MSIYEKWKLTPDERMLQGLRLFPHIDAEQLPQKLQSRRLRGGCDGRHPSRSGNIPYIPRT